MTKIQWTDETSNPIHLVRNNKNGGHWCQKISEGCANCYAEAQNQNGFFSFASNLPYTGNPPDLILDNKILKQWENARISKKIFVCSMTDLFGDWIPRFWQQEIFESMAKSKHTFQVLTKRPSNLASFIRQQTGLTLDNIWLGVSIESQKYIDRIIPLAQCKKDNIVFLSIEPLLGEINLQLDELVNCDDECKRQKWELISWVIVGGESGNNARSCNIEWVRSIVKQCQQFNIPVFVKQLGSLVVNDEGERIKYKHSKGGNIEEFPNDLQIREFPARGSV